VRIIRRHIRGAVLLAVALVILCAITQGVCQAATLNVLFIGNSFTFFNNMPGLFRNVASSSGAIEPNVASSAVPSYSLENHLSDPATLSAIDNGYSGSHQPWDVVVIQECNWAAYAEQDEWCLSSFQTGALGLYDRIKLSSPNARIVFFENPAFNERYWVPDWPAAQIGPDSMAQQDSIRRSYANIAYAHIPANSVSERKSDTEIALCGDAWVRNYSCPTGILLHDADCRHPALAGSYLSSLVLYSKIYNAVPTGISYTGGLDRQTADYLQGMAVAPVVNDETPPGPVTLFTSAGGDMQNVLTWTNPADTDYVGARIVYKTDGPPQNLGDGVLLADVWGIPGAISSFTHARLTNGTMYYYAAFSHDAVNVGPPAQASAVPADVTAPGQIKAFLAIPNNGRVGLSWVNPTDSDFVGVKILAKTSGYPTSVSDGAPFYDGASTTCIHTGLTNGVTYYYAAFTYDEVSNYSASALNMASPQALPDWVNDTFDGYSIGDLECQNGWSIAGTSGQVQSDLAKGGTGKALLLDTVAQGTSIFNQLGFTQKDSGVCYLSFDVAQDATGTVGQLMGYISIYGSTSTAEIAKVVIQKGKLMVDYGSGSLAVLTTTAASRTWYNIRIGLNIEARTMDLWLDGFPKGTGYAWKGSGTNVARILVGSDRNSNLSQQKMYIDSVRVEPKPGQVAVVWDDGAWSPSPSKIHFSFEPVAGTPEYRYCIGTTSGGGQTKGWTNCGTSINITAMELPLAENSSTYYITVQCLNLYGTAGANKTSNGIKIASGLAKVNDAKALVDGTPSAVKALRGKVVSAAFPGHFYIQEPSGPFGLKIVSTASVTAGDQVDVCGVMKGAGSERYLDCTGNGVIGTNPGPGGPYAPMLTSASLGGIALNSYAPGVVGGLGPNNIGLYAMLCGRVTQRQDATPMYFYLDDGRGMRDGTTTGGAPNVGVRVIADPSGLAEGSCVAAKGVVSCFDSSGLRPELLASEIQLLRAP
jgi:hypothetical protein